MPAPAERPVLGIVGSSAGRVTRIRTELVEPAMQRGWTVGVTLTPTAAIWLRDSGEFERIEQVTGLPVRCESRLPTQLSPHPPVDCYLVAPATANTVAKLALGIADNQALTQVCEAIGGGEIPVVVAPATNLAHSGHPAWRNHLGALAEAGVHIVERGEDEFAWAEILARTAQVLGSNRTNDPGIV